MSLIEQLLTIALSLGRDVHWSANANVPSLGSVKVYHEQPFVEGVGCIPPVPNNEPKGMIPLLSHRLQSQILSAYRICIVPGHSVDRVGICVSKRTPCYSLFQVLTDVSHWSTELPCFLEGTFSPSGYTLTLRRRRCHVINDTSFSNEKDQQGAIIFL